MADALMDRIKAHRSAPTVYDPPTFEQMADRIEELNERLIAATDDAKEAEAYAEELEADRKKTYEALLKVSRIHGEVEAKLAACEKYRDAYAECDRIGTQTVRDLEARNKELTLQLLATHGQAADALDKLTKAVEALRECQEALRDYMEHYPHMAKGYTVDAEKKARIVLAELEGKE